MLAESLLTLAGQAGRMLVAAASTDAWDTTRGSFAQLLGRGNPESTRLAWQRLDETREQLVGGPVRNAEKTRAVLAERWATRLADLMEEQPEAEATVRALLQEIRS